MCGIAEKFSAAIKCVFWKEMPDDARRKDVAKAVGISPQSLGDYVLGRRAKGDEEVRRKICEYFGVNYQKVLDFGEVLIRWGDDGYSLSDELKADVHAGLWDKEIDDLLSTPGEIPPAFSDFTLIPKYKTHLSGGHGSYLVSDQIEANLAFRTEFIRSKGNPNHMALFTVMGESMEPFLYDGDVVMVDCSHNDATRIHQEKAYAYREEGRVSIKRLMWRGKELIAKSENTAYEPYAVDYKGDFSLIGKAVWVGHEIR